MSVRTVKISSLGLAAACLTLGLTGCATSADPAGTGGLGAVPTGSSAPAAPPSSAPATVVTPAPPTTAPPAAPPTTAPPTTAPPATVAALKCSQLKSAEVGSTTVSYNGYHDSIPLGGLGLWSGEDGNTVTLQKQCGIGDLDGDGAKDAVGVVMLSSGGTGQFFTLVVWHNKKAKPVCVAVADIGDRNPVKSIDIVGGKAVVIYYTRTDDAPMAEINIKRTAVYQLVGSKFKEISHVDVPGTYGS